MVEEGGRNKNWLLLKMDPGRPSQTGRLEEVFLNKLEDNYKNMRHFDTIGNSLHPKKCASQELLSVSLLDGANWYCNSTTVPSGTHYTRGIND